MNRLEVFFDYFCPFCQKGFSDLKKLYPHYPDMEIVWYPWTGEHPRSENNMCVRGMYFALDCGLDIWEYHDRVYRATLIEHKDIGSIEAFLECFKGLPYVDAMNKALQNGEYAKAQREENLKVCERYGIWEIPAYRMNGMKLDAVIGQNIRRDKLKEFFDAATQCGITNNT